MTQVWHLKLSVCTSLHINYLVLLLYSFLIALNSSSYLFFFLITFGLYTLTGTLNSNWLLFLIITYLMNKDGS